MAGLWGAGGIWGYGAFEAIMPEKEKEKSRLAWLFYCFTMILFMFGGKVCLSCRTTFYMELINCLWPRCL